MAWTIKYSEIALKQLKKLDKFIADKIDSYLVNKIAVQPNPKAFAKALSHDRIGMWRFRVGDYRIICQIQDDELIVLVTQVGHRKEIYG